MNRKKCGAFFILLTTVGVFGAPQWYQNGPYSNGYSSYDGMGAAQMYENLYDDEMQPKSNWSDTPDGSDSYDVEDYQSQEDTMDALDNEENSIDESFCGFKPDEGQANEFRERGHKFENKIVRYKISQYSKNMSNTDVNNIIAKAFGAWSQVVDLKFIKIGEKGQADIDIRFAAYSHRCDSAFDGPGKILAHARKNYVHFDDTENWSKRVGGDVTNLYAVAVHEIGHTLGLAHSDDHNAIMYGQYFRGAPTMKLGADDIAGIQKIYGLKQGSIRPRNGRPVTPSVGRPMRRPPMSRLMRRPHMPHPMGPPMFPHPMEPPMLPHPMEPPMLPHPMEPPMLPHPMEPPMLPHPMGQPIGPPMFPHPMGPPMFTRRCRSQSCRQWNHRRRFYG